MWQQILTLFILLAGIACSSSVVGAAQESYDIDLKELRRPTVRRTKEPLKEGTVQEPYDIDLNELRRPPVRRAKEPQKKAESASPHAKGESSSYTVQSGD